MLSPRRLTGLRLSIGACILGGASLIVGCDGGSGPEMTPAETDKLQKNEMEARQKAFGKTGMVVNKNSAKAAKPAAPPAEPAPAKE